jgi:multicomponent Na+:H+ antiporter subunit F
MTDSLSLAVLGLTLALLLGLLRVLLGPTDGDRMLAIQLIGSTGVGLLLLFGQWFDQPALLDVGLILALLAAVASAAFTARPMDRPHE